MNRDKIVVVEDEPAVREMLRFILLQNGFQMLEAETANEAERLIANERPSLILLDWMLPGVSGVEFARYLKHNPVTCEIPVIMLTARGEEDDKVKGLESGADDYITKPFSPRELVARVRSMLRRSGPTGGSQAIEIEGLQLDPTSHRVWGRGEPIKLGPTEFRLLQFFMSHAERVYSRGQLLDRVWGTHVYIEERTVDVHIRRLRKALEPSGFDTMIQTVRSVGYRFSGVMKTSSVGNEMVIPPSHDCTEDTIGA